MFRRRNNTQSLLLFAGFFAFAIAVLSIVDMFRLRPYDGVVLEADTPGQLIVREVAPDSGAEQAAIVPGDQIVGISRNILRSAAHASDLIGRRQIGERLPYFLRNAQGQLREVTVELGPRTFGSPTYLYACILGFSFFFIGLFVFSQQPDMRAAHVFFALGCLFLLFLVCRLRPASYSMVDTFVLRTGTVALLLLPPSFLHFFLLFPRPIWRRAGEPEGRPPKARWNVLLFAFYVLPTVAFLASYAAATARGSWLPLISGAPISNWWILAGYLVAGLIVLAVNSTRLRSRRMRSGAGWILLGSIFGLVPFLVLVIAFPKFLHQGRYLLYGLLPIALVPLTFAFAIIRFQILDIRVILRKSLLYTATSAVVTAFYAVGIVAFNSLSKLTDLASSRFFPILFALTIALLFEPIRRRLQVLVDSFFFAERIRLRQTMLEFGEALTAQVDPMTAVKEVVERLPGQLGLRFAALYLIRGGRLQRVAGPANLPEELSLLPMLQGLRASEQRLRPLEALRPLTEASPELSAAVDQLQEKGVEIVGDLASRRRSLGFLLLSGKLGQMQLDREELALLESLLRQTAIAIEAGLLLEEKTQQAELEREMEIAADVQTSLLPASLSFAPGWDVAAACRPAKHVGGDFYTVLPASGPGNALAYGDVSGKSVSGALVMMAAHEILHSLAMTQTCPEQLLNLANERLYSLGQRKGFVALGYFASSDNGNGLRYVLAGQPQPLLRHISGEVEELPLPPHRLPLGALRGSNYRCLEATVEPGELVLGYSDGVVEARSASGEFFGTERLIQVVSQTSPEPRAVIDRVLESIDHFTDGTEPYDDLTLVAVAAHGRSTR